MSTTSTRPPHVSPLSAKGRFFATDHLQSNVNARSVRGGVATLGAQAVTFLLKLGSTAVLARLLTPGDFGLVAMVTAVTAFVAMFKDAGLSMATVQQEHVSHEQVSTLFWINVALSAVLMLATAALAPLIAWFYAEPRLTGITIALAAAFLFGGLAVQHQALLTRHMRFGALAAIAVLSNAMGIAAAIVGAACGLGYWSLVLMAVATAAGNAVLVWLLTGWLPGLPVRGAGVRPMLSFGANLTGFSFINYFAGNADNLLIGWYWGATALGLYSRSYAILMLPISQLNAPVGAVAIPAMSRLQACPEHWKRYYLEAVAAITFLATPLAVLLCVFTPELVSVLLGPDWSGAAPIFRFLAASALVQPLCNSTGWVYISRGRTDRMFRWGVAAAVVTVLSFVAGLPFGACGVAISSSAARLLLTWPCLAYACQGTSLRAREIARAVAPPTAAAVAAGGVIWVAKTWWQASSAAPLLTLGAGTVAFTGLYLALMALSPTMRSRTWSLVRTACHA